MDAPDRPAGSATPEHRAPLAAPLPEEVAGDFLARLCYVSEDLVSYELAGHERREVAFRLRPGREEAAAEVARRIAQVAQTMAAGHRPMPTKVLVDRSDFPVPFRDDPHPPLEASEELLPLGVGRYGFGPRMTALIDALDRVVRRMEEPLGASERQFPSLIGADVLDRCRYLRSFPHALSFVSHLREDLDTIQRFSAEAAVNEDGDLHPARESLAEVQCLLAPTVCFHWYASLADSQRETPLAISARGKCFRYESSNLQALERLWDFTMRELIFVGPAETVLAARSHALEASTALFDGLGLAYRIETAHDPFFVEGYSQQRGFQAAFDLKFELRTALPYRDGSVASGSFNYHQDFFGRSLDITGPDGEPLHTACVGFGLERLALSVVAQYGPEPDGWPEMLRDEIGRATGRPDAPETPR